MKKLLIAAIGLVSLLCTACQQKEAEGENPNLYCVMLNRVWGYINQEGETAVPLQYFSAFPFSDNGLALVQEEENGPYGFINAKGEYVIKPKYTQAFPFCDGVAVVVRKGGAPTLINSSGKKVKELKGVYRVGPFSEGLAAFCVLKKRSNYFELLWGYLDTEGEVVVEPQYREAYPFKEGLANVLTQNGEIYIDANGKEVFALKSDDEEERPVGSNFQDGMARLYLMKEETFGFLNRKGEIAVPTRFRYVGFFNEGLSTAVEPGQELFGYIDKNGEYLIAPRFTGAGMFSNGLAGVQENDRWGFIDRDGQWVIPPQYEDCSEFHGDVAPVQKFRGWGLIDKDGNYRIQPDYFKIQLEWDYQDDEFIESERTDLRK